MYRRARPPRDKTYSGVVTSDVKRALCLILDKNSDAAARSERRRNEASSRQRRRGRRRRANRIGYRYESDEDYETELRDMYVERTESGPAPPDKSSCFKFSVRDWTWASILKRWEIYA